MNLLLYLFFRIFYHCTDIKFLEIYKYYVVTVGEVKKRLLPVIPVIPGGFLFHVGNLGREYTNIVH